MKQIARVLAALLAIQSTGLIYAQETKKADLYTVPAKASPEELFTLIKKLISHRPETPAAQRAHMEKMPKAVRAASELIVKKEKNKETERFTTAQGILFELRIREIAGKPKKEHMALVDDIIAYFKARKSLGQYEMVVTQSLGQYLSQSGSKKAALKAYKELGAILEKKADARLKPIAKMLSGSARQLDLVGNTFELTGKTTEGANFDLKSLKGKVILVDFWATWCGPCRAEYPNIKSQYEKYHSKGFEVVGVSLDENRGALDKYLADQKVPWKTLHAPGGQHPAAAYYGVQSIPFVVLINRAGKVVSTDARGKTLRDLLKKEFSAPSGD